MTNMIISYSGLKIAKSYIIAGYKDMTEQIFIGSRCITYVLVRKNVKNINLRIKPDMTITVSANPQVSKSYIEKFLISKSEWIEKTLQHIKNRESTQYGEIEFKDGEKVRLLGKDFILRIVPLPSNRINIDNGCITIYTKNVEDINEINHTWNKWFERFIKETLVRIVYEVHPKFEEYHINIPVIKLRNMKTRWGTCAFNKETITLNKKLIHMPKECIEYVVVHELTHFLYPNHSKSFYHMVSIIMPDYKARKKLLERQALS